MAFDNDSYIYRKGMTPNTKAAVSQKNKIFSYAFGAGEFSQLGVVNTFDPSESRAVDPIRGIGYGDQIAELVPGVTEPVELSINRTLLYLLNGFQAFGYKGGVDGLVRSLKHHRWPFDIKQELVFSVLESNNAGSAFEGTVTATDGINKALLTFYEACWMTSYGLSFPADSAIVSESISVRVSDIVDGSSVYGENNDTGLDPFNGELGSFRFSGALPTAIASV
jgi:hypothetical protein